MKELETNEVKKVTQGALSLADSYAGFSVSNAEEYTAGANHLKEIKAAQKEVNAERKAITDPMNAAKTRVMDFFRKFTDRLDDAERGVKQALANYSMEQERIAREAARKEQEKADRRRAKLEAEAAAAREKGREERAQTLADRAEAVTTAPVPVATPKVKGVSTRKAWKYEITKVQDIPREYLMVDEKKIRAVVNALKADASIPGVRVYSENIISSRS